MVEGNDNTPVEIIRDGDKIEYFGTSPDLEIVRRVHRGGIPADKKAVDGADLPGAEERVKRVISKSKIE